MIDRFRNLPDEERYPLSEMAVIFTMNTPKNDSGTNALLIIEKLLDRG